MLAALLSSVRAEAQTVDQCITGKLRCIARLTACSVGCVSQMVKNGVTAETLTDCQTACDRAIWGPLNADLSCFDRLENKTGCVTSQLQRSNSAVEALSFVEFKVMTPLIPTVTCGLDAIVSPIEIHSVCTGAQGPSRCTALKMKCVGKLAACSLNCYASAHAKGVPVSQGCLAGCKDRFDGGTVPAKGCFAKLEAKYSNECLTTGDAWALQPTGGEVAADVDTVFLPQ